MLIKGELLGGPVNIWREVIVLVSKWPRGFSFTSFGLGVLCTLTTGVNDSFFTSFDDIA